MAMIVPPLSARWGGAVGSVGCACTNTRPNALCTITGPGTPARATCNREEGKGYSPLPRRPGVGAHGQREWARGDDGDGIREGHTNTIEGMGTTGRNFLRPFRGVPKKSLKYYVARCEHKINRKRISPTFIAQLVQAHESFT